MENEEYQKIAGTKVYRFERETGSQQWTNKNRLLTEKYKYSTGGKTGYTKRAGRTLITTAEKNDIELIAVTLNAPDDWNDHITMYEDAFGSINLKTIIEAGPIMIKNKTLREESLQQKEIYLEKPIIYPLFEAESREIKIEYKLLQDEQLKQLTTGKAGVAILYLQNKPVMKVPIFIRELEQKENKGLWEKFKNLLFSQTGVMHND